MTDIFVIDLTVKKAVHIIRCEYVTTYLTLFQMVHTQVTDENRESTAQFQHPYCQESSAMYFHGRDN